LNVTVDWQQVYGDPLVALENFFYQVLHNFVALENFSFFVQHIFVAQKNYLFQVLQTHPELQQNGNGSLIFFQSTGGKFSSFEANFSLMHGDTHLGRQSAFLKICAPCILSPKRHFVLLLAPFRSAQLCSAFIIYHS